MYSTTTRSTVEVCFTVFLCVVYIISETSSLAVPCPAVEGCFCDHLPAVHCVGLSQFPAALPHDNATTVVLENSTLHVLQSENLTAFSSVERLTITRSSVYFIEPGAFSAMQRLISLDLSYNQLRQGPKTFLGPAHLKELSLKGNNLQLTPNLESLRELEKLWLSENYGLDFSMEHFLPRSLREVYLDHCGLLTVPHTLFLKAIRDVTLLNLDFNFITFLDRNQFDSLNELETLSLQHNRLRQVDKHAFESQSNLRFIGLAYNNLTTLDDETFDKFDHNLQVLTLNNNKLTSLPDDLLGSRQSLNEIHLSFNPWNCDCFLQWMRSLDEDVVADNDNFTCASPEHVADFLVLNVTSSLVCDSPNKGFLVTITVIIVTGCLLLTGFAIYRVCKNRRQRSLRSSSDAKYVPAERR